MDIIALSHYIFKIKLQLKSFISSLNLDYKFINANFVSNWSLHFPAVVTSTKLYRKATVIYFQNDFEIIHCYMTSFVAKCS